MGFMAGIETGGIHDLNWNRFVSRFEFELMGFKAGNGRNNDIKHATYRCWPCFCYRYSNRLLHPVSPKRIVN